MLAVPIYKDAVNELILILVPYGSNLSGNHDGPGYPSISSTCSVSQCFNSSYKSPQSVDPPLAVGCPEPLLINSYISMVSELTLSASAGNVISKRYPDPRVLTVLCSLTLLELNITGYPSEPGVN